MDFEEIVVGIELEVDEPIIYRNLSNLDLIDALVTVRKDLLDRGVLIYPVEIEDWDKQSTYYGLLWEIKRREEGGTI